MKATILVRDLVKLIAKHGDCDVKVCLETCEGMERWADVKCIDECVGDVDTFEIYGEEQ